MLQRRAPLILLTVAAATLAGCAGGPNASHDSSRTDVRAETESLYDRYRRVTNHACNSLRRHEALTAGTNRLCAPFDSIPAVASPEFVDADRAELPAAEPVVALELRTEARAYPVRYLAFHEVVNDTLAGVPVVVSFCPLCNSAAAHVRRSGGRTLTFGVSGQLSSANLIMFDRQTLSRWQQMTGAAITGELEGERLASLPVTQDGRFLERATGSVFDFFGRAVSGPRRQLSTVPQVTSFWFAWAHFHPRTQVVERK